MLLLLLLLLVVMDGWMDGWMDVRVWSGEEWRGTTAKQNACGPKQCGCIFAESAIWVFSQKGKSIIFRTQKRTTLLLRQKEHREIVCEIASVRVW